MAASGECKNNRAKIRDFLLRFLKKPSRLMFDNNFGKCEPIFIVLSPGDS